MIIRFRPEVADDIATAFEYYESKCNGLGSEFVQEYRRTLEIVVARPLSLAIAQHGYRPCQLKRSPYLIHFNVSNDVVLIVAVLAACRDNDWKLDRE
jgi:ParE toxin of type II toxin-antitoxin system, parDE